MHGLAGSRPGSRPDVFRHGLSPKKGVATKDARVSEGAPSREESISFSRVYFGMSKECKDHCPEVTKTFSEPCRSNLFRNTNAALL